MGGSGSTRRVVVEENDGGGVVKISDSVVKRIRGLEDTPGDARRPSEAYSPRAQSGPSKRIYEASPSGPYETSSARSDASGWGPGASTSGPEAAWQHEASGARPQAYGAGPQASGTGPQASGVGPQASGAGLQASGTGPQASGAGPQAFGAGPQASGAGPQASGAGPQASGAGPQASGAGPQAYGAGPQAYGTRPQAAAWTPEASDSRPRAAWGPEASGTKAHGAASGAQAPRSRLSQVSSHSQPLISKGLNIQYPLLGKGGDERTVQDVEAFYLERLRQLEQRNSELQKITNEQFVKAVQEVEQKFLKHSCSPCCQDLQSKVYECYLGYPKQSLLCSAQVRAFSTCVERARQNALLRKG